MHHRQLGFWPQSDLDPISPQSRFGLSVFFLLPDNFEPPILLRAALGSTTAVDGLEKEIMSEIINSKDMATSSISFIV